MPLLTVEEASKLTRPNNNQIMTRGRWSEIDALRLLYRNISGCADDAGDIVSFLLGHIVGEELTCCEKRSSHVTIFEYCDGRRASDYIVECCSHYEQRKGWRFSSYRRDEMICDIMGGCEVEWDTPYSLHGHYAGYFDWSFGHADGKWTLFEVQRVHNGGCLYSPCPEVVIQGHGGLARSLYFKDCQDGTRQNALGEVLASSSAGADDWVGWLHDGELARLFCVHADSMLLLAHDDSNAIIHRKNPATCLRHCDSCGTRHGRRVLAGVPGALSAVYLTQFGELNRRLVNAAVRIMARGEQ